MGYRSQLHKSYCSNIGVGFRQGVLTTNGEGRSSSPPPMSPRAAEPKRMIQSGWATWTTRLAISPMSVASGLPCCLMYCLATVMGSRNGSEQWITLPGWRLVGVFWRRGLRVRRTIWRTGGGRRGRCLGRTRGGRRLRGGRGGRGWGRRRLGRRA